MCKLWKDCLTTTLEKIDLMVMNRDITEIELVFDLRLPCATVEYENIRNIREKIQQLEADNNKSFDYFNYAIDQIKTISIYGEQFMELVFNDQRYFDIYFYDQIALHLSEMNIHLSPKFVFDLLTSNPTRSLEQKARLSLTQYTEFTEILRLFEIGLQLTSEEEICQQMKKQLIEKSSR
jgi:hypothetical protein